MSESYHTTSTDLQYNALEEIEGAFKRIMAETVRMQIIHALEELYSSSGIYKVSSRMLKDRIPKISGGTVSAEISNMKKKGLITDLNEVVPGQKAGAASYYFALSSVLEKVTDPKTPVKTDIKEENEKMANTKTPATIPAQPVSNPFDKVYTLLDTISAQIKGLSNGYSDVATTLKHIKEGATPSVSSSEISSEVVNEVRDLLNTHPVRLGEGTRNALANSVAIRLQSNLEVILKAMENVGNSPIPTNATEEYKEAFKDGIKFALEMGLVTR
jgi:hypothetical protein